LSHTPVATDTIFIQDGFYLRSKVDRFLLAGALKGKNRNHEQRYDE